MAVESQEDRSNHTPNTDPSLSKSLEKAIDETLREVEEWIATGEYGQNAVDIYTALIDDLDGVRSGESNTKLLSKKYLPPSIR